MGRAANRDMVGIFGALKLLDSPRQPVLPLATIAKAILAASKKRQSG
jgi:hypothetical protein